MSATGRLRSVFAGVMLAAMAVRAEPARAEAPEDTVAPDDAAKARLAFEEGRALLKEDNLDEACAAFAESQQLSPTIAALLNLGVCEQRRGRFATALDYFEKAARESLREGDAARAATAKEDAEEVARLVGTLTIRPATHFDDAVECRVDGVVVPLSPPPAARAMDRGEHTVELRRGGRAISTTIVVVSDGAPTYFDVPDTGPEPRVSAPPRRGSAPTTATKPGRHIPLASYVAAGVGVASLAVGFGFGAAGWAKYAEAEQTCPKHRCSTSGPVDLYASALDDARAANIAAALGATAIAAGVVIYFVYGGSRENVGAVRVSTTWVRGGAAAALDGAF